MIPQKNLTIKDYDYQLPDQRIAKFPLDNREASKLLVFKDDVLTDQHFSQITNYFNQSDCLIFNNTRVIPARLTFEKESGARIEIFCLEPFEPADYSLALNAHQTCKWKCMVGNIKRWKSGNLIKIISISNTLFQLSAKLIEKNAAFCIVQFSWPNQSTFIEMVEMLGSLPIPPYLNREPETSDNTQYQTVYAQEKGSVAAPTAGLHFTLSILDKFKAQGTTNLELTLHVGAGTFKPVKSEILGDHLMHSELFEISIPLLEKLLNCTGAICCVGTTSLRTIESIYWLANKHFNNQNADILNLNQWEAYDIIPKLKRKESIAYLLDYLKNKNQEKLTAHTSLLIAPGYKFRVANRLITNFHQPQSTLLLLVSAFTGLAWKKIYDHALANNYRFLSYGDSSILFGQEISD